MARRRKKPESVTVAGFTWTLSPPASDPERERWTLEVPGVMLHVTDYGSDDPRAADGGYFKGWRVVCGGPRKEEYGSRDEAMEGAVKGGDIEREIRFLVGLAPKAPKAREAARLAREAGLEI